MRYTRYNYKPPRKKNNFMLVFILIIIAAIALGTIFSKLLPKNNTKATATADDKTTKIGLEKDKVTNKDATNPSKVSSEGIINDYVAIQCGNFSNKANALVLKNSLMKSGTPFIIEEDNSNRVLLGIYPKGNIDSITKELQANKIEYVKINFQVIGNDATGSQINEMINADLKILNKLSEKDISGVQTVELKKWLGTLKGADEKSASFNTMTEIKAYLTALPVEFKKEKTEEGYIYIYRFIKKLSKI
ncbi:MAG: SPOR domain-containing protein [Clostridium sp.]|uniref:SPOR domain-containing protein n=1 Tax=Clostridium sp. TaxID=1506 RepID=UPI003D6D5ECA